MIDDDDVTTAILLAPIGGSGPVGCFFTVLGILVVIVIAVIASNNQEECEAKQCGAGSARLLDGECVCTTVPK